jgi:hypothetical protein
MNLNGPLKMSEVAAMMGWSRKRTVRQLEAIDREVGGMLLIKRGDGAGRRYYVTKAALRRVCPDWFEVVVNLVDRVAALEESAKDSETRLNLVAHQVGSNSREIARLKTKRPEASKSAHRAA